MADVTAKVRLDRKVWNSDGQVSLLFQPDYQNPANAAWAEATPHLSLSMTVKGDVGEHFQQGESYDLLFRKAQA